MGLFTTALVFGAGYTLGTPGGREQVTTYLRQARAQARTPQAVRLRERGWDIAADQVRTLTRRADADGADSDIAASPRRGVLRRRRPRPHPAAANPAVTTTGTAPTPQPSAAPTAPAPADLGGTSVEEDSRAVLPRMDSPPPAPPAAAPQPPPARS